MTLAKETHDYLLSKFISNVKADSEETANEYFDDKLNNALKDIERISDVQQIIFTMLFHWVRDETDYL